RGLGVDAGVVEINGLTGSAASQIRAAFLQLINDIAKEFGLEPRLHKALNEIYLYDEFGRAPVKFYQDHCRDRDCGNCRNVHLRVGPSAGGWQAAPCFLKAQTKTIPLIVDGRLSPARFEDAIRYNGRGPDWDEGSAYRHEA